MLICGSATPHLASVFKCEMAEVHSLFTVLMARKNRACLPNKEEGTFIHKDFFFGGGGCCAWSQVSVGLRLQMRKVAHFAFQLL